jgi:hypothetical protein
MEECLVTARLRYVATCQQRTDRIVKLSPITGRGSLQDSEMLKISSQMAVTLSVLRAGRALLISVRG